MTKKEADSSHIIAEPQIDFAKTDMVCGWHSVLRGVEKVTNTVLSKKRHIYAFTEAKSAV